MPKPTALLFQLQAGGATSLTCSPPKPLQTQRDPLVHALEPIQHSWLQQRWSGNGGPACVKRISANLAPSFSIPLPSFMSQALYSFNKRMLPSPYRYIFGTLLLHLLALKLFLTKMDLLKLSCPQYMHVLPHPTSQPSFHLPVPNRPHRSASHPSLPQCDA